MREYLIEGNIKPFRVSFSKKVIKIFGIDVFNLKPKSYSWVIL